MWWNRKFELNLKLLWIQISFSEFALEKCGKKCKLRITPNRKPIININNGDESIKRTHTMQSNACYTLTLSILPLLYLFAPCTAMSKLIWLVANRIIGCYYKTWNKTSSQSSLTPFDAMSKSLGTKIDTFSHSKWMSHTQSTEFYCKLMHLIYSWCAIRMISNYLFTSYWIKICQKWYIMVWN